MSKRAETRQKFIDALVSSGKSEVTTEDIKKICSKIKVAHPYWFTNEEANRLKRGIFKVPGTMPVSKAQTIDMSAQIMKMPEKNTVANGGHRITNVVTDLDISNLVPSVYKNYVPFGNFDDVLAIVQSERFFPVFVTGQSGNGKTMSIEQACAKAKRKFVVVSMTPETDEGDLLGNYVLINGQMEWRDGPVTTAARQGAVLCIDEIDYGANNLSSLQRVFEGKPFLLKKKGEVITPAPGFTVFATANTKGKGSDDGRYMFTNVLNEAFLERFVNTIEQDWPPLTIEKKILKKELATVGKLDDDFAEKLVTWADVIRKTFADGGCDEVISTRRLVHIVETYGIFGDKMKAINLCLNRFDDDTKASFVDLYTKVDAGATAEEILAPVVEPEVTAETEPQDDSF